MWGKEYYVFWIGVKHRSKGILLSRRGIELESTVLDRTNSVMRFIFILKGWLVKSWRISHIAL